MQVSCVEKLEANLTQMKSNPQNAVPFVDQKKKMYAQTVKTGDQ